MNKILLLSFCAFLALNGCGRLEKKSESPQLKSYKLIDAGRSDEAIVLMERELEANPENRSYRMTLASAYAHKAGFKIQKLLPLIKNGKPLPSWKSIQKANAKKSKTELATLKLSWHLRNYLHFMETYRSIPDIHEDKIGYLRAAIETMQVLEKPYPEEALYRTVLNVLLLKYQIQNEILGKKKSQDTCKIDLSFIEDRIKSVGETLIDMMSDMEIVTPKKKKEYSELREDTVEVVFNAKVTLELMKFNGALSDADLASLASRSGYDNLFGCEVH
ncbi:MAG: tetratricopeptide repeat protein [Pseudobdellovibrionaceae bacterium]